MIISVPPLPTHRVGEPRFLSTKSTSIREMIRGEDWCPGLGVKHPRERGSHLREAPNFRYVVQGGGRMDQKGTADLAQFPQPPSNSGPQEMERIAGSVRGHLLLCPPLTRHLPDHPHTPPPWPVSVYTGYSSLVWQEVGWVRIQRAGALQLLQGNYPKATFQLAN